LCLRAPHPAPHRKREPAASAQRATPGAAHPAPMHYMLRPIVAPSGLLTDRSQCEDTRYGSFTLAHRHATAASTPHPLPQLAPAVGRPPKAVRTARVHRTRDRSSDADGPGRRPDESPRPTRAMCMPLHLAAADDPAFGSPRRATRGACHDLAVPRGESGWFHWKATRAWIGSYVDSEGGEPVPSYCAQQPANTYTSIPRCIRPRHHAPLPRGPAPGVKVARDGRTGHDTRVTLKRVCILSRGAVRSAGKIVVQESAHR